MPGEPWALIPRSRDAIVGTHKARHRDPVARSPGCGCLCSDPGISLLSGGLGRYPHPGLGLGTPPPTVLVLDRSSVFSSSHGYFDAREKAAWELNGAKIALGAVFFCSSSELSGCQGTLKGISSILAAHPHSPALLLRARQN
ncbi:hypothetical protein CISG_02449 [Coccidioides immitis RMSCC 3703]|uniref:Uncharacterized protein n=1 Tax=Coccidioides immitis RMSCC 3703 TaxID=454286 RepID=A0A0J8R9K1_COCIT|nr:hypothetical protein CISG_02449 [Coccidioides immitis RMSCC 3703]